MEIKKNKEKILESETNKVLNVMKAIHPELDYSNFNVNKIPGGLSRKAYLVECHKSKIKYCARILMNSQKDIEVRKEPEQLYILDYSKEEEIKENFYKDIFVNNEMKESTLFKLFSLYNIGPKYIGEYNYFCEIENKFKCVRLEKFLEGRQIKAEETLTDKYFYKVACLIGKIHSLGYLECNNEKNFIFKKLSDENLLINFNTKCNVELYESPEDKEFIQKVRNFSSATNVKKILSLLENKKQVLSHNDIWVGNIFIEKSLENIGLNVEKNQNNTIEENLFLIDLETMDYNIPGYDLGKFLYEPMIGRLPNSIKHYLIKENFPSEERIKKFVLCYYLSYRLNKARREGSSFTNKKINEIIKNKNYEIPDSPSSSSELNGYKILEMFTTNKMIDSLAEDDFEKFEKFIIDNKICNSYNELESELNILHEEIFIGIVGSCYWLIIICVVCGKDFSNQMNLFEFAKDEFYVFEKFSPKLGLIIE